MEQIRKEDGTMEWRGVFTSQLIDTLKSDGLREEATYEDLIEAMAPVDSQTPLFQGSARTSAFGISVDTGCRFLDIFGSRIVLHTVPFGLS